MNIFNCYNCIISIIAARLIVIGSSVDINEIINNVNSGIDDSSNAGLTLVIKNTALFLPRKDVVSYWTSYIKNNNFSKILEVGPGGEGRNFVPATHVVDFDPTQYNTIVNSNNVHSNNKISFNIDIDEDSVPVGDDYFDFVYCRHVLEDLHSPVIAFRELIRLSRRGYIETPSPMIESVQHIYGERPSPGLGFIHHRYMLWTDYSTNTLLVLPKYPVIDFISIPNRITRTFNSIMTNDISYINNYYTWDKDDSSKQPRIKVLKHGIDYNLLNYDSYSGFIYSGSELSINNTIEFFNRYINQ